MSMIGNYNYGTDHRHQPIHTMIEAIRHKGWNREEIETNLLHKIIQQVGNNLTVEVIIDHTESHNIYPKANPI